MAKVFTGLALTLVASPALATPTVPELDGGLALTVAAVVIGVGAVVYEKLFRK